MGLKLSSQDEVSQSDGVRSVQQFIAVQKMMDRVHDRARCDDDAPGAKRRRSAYSEPKSALTWHRDRMVCYALTARRATTNSSVLTISVDGSRVGNRDLQVQM